MILDVRAITMMMSVHLIVHVAAVILVSKMKKVDIVMKIITVLPDVMKVMKMMIMMVDQDAVHEEISHHRAVLHQDKAGLAIQKAMQKLADIVMIMIEEAHQDQTEIKMRMMIMMIMIAQANLAPADLHNRAVLHLAQDKAGLVIPKAMHRPVGVVMIMIGEAHQDQAEIKMMIMMIMMIDQTNLAPVDLHNRAVLHLLAQGRAGLVIPKAMLRLAGIVMIMIEEAHQDQTEIKMMMMIMIAQANLAPADLHNRAVLHLALDKAGLVILRVMPRLVAIAMITLHLLNQDAVALNPVHPAALHKA